MKPCKCPSRYIPEAVKRPVRQRCGFGCIFCGNPIIEYHHIEEWTKLKKAGLGHDPAKITLLCDNHHRRAGAGLITKEQVLARDKSPRNRSSGMTAKEALWYDGTSCNMHLGGGLRCSDMPIVVPFIAVCVNGRSLLSARVEDHRLLFSVEILDEKNNLLLQIRDNELSFSTDSWDARFEGRRLTIVSAGEEVRLQLQFDPPGTIVVASATLICDGEKIIVNEECVSVGGRKLINCIAYCSSIALAIGPAPWGGVCFSIPSRYGAASSAAVVVGGPDVEVHNIAVGGNMWAPPRL